MPVIQCASGCDRLISVSSVPGGNPAARADPDGFASQWTACTSCGGFTCDRCLAKGQGKCKCGAEARLYSEAEQIEVANNMARGLPPVTRVVPAPPPAMAPALRASAPLAPIPIRLALEGTAHQIESDLQRQLFDRARAMAMVCSTILSTQADGVTAPELPWLMQFGESFYRWRLPSEGSRYWLSLWRIAQRLLPGSAEVTTALGTFSAFQILSGQIEPPDATTMAANVFRAFGPTHPLAAAVHARMGAPPPAEGALRAAVPASPQGSAHSGPPGSLSSLDPQTRLALWVTLAFFDVATSDGQVSEAEYTAWKQNIRRMSLPDVWDRFGRAAGFKAMLDRGALQQLSMDFMSLSIEERTKLTSLLVEFMIADGKAEPAEMQAIRRIGGWLGVTLKFE